MVNTSFTMQKKVPVTSNSELVPLEQLHPIIRTLLIKSTPNVPLAGSTISLGKNCSGSRNIIYCKWVLNPISMSPISEENTKLNKNVKRTIFIIGTGRYENVREVNYPKSSTHRKEISEQPQKKNGGSRPVINLENINKLIPQKHFKTGGLHCLKFFLEQDNLLLKIDLKEAYFFLVSVNKSYQRNVRFQW